MFANKVCTIWNLRGTDKNNGTLLLNAVNDHKMRRPTLFNSCGRSSSGGSYSGRGGSSGSRGSSSSW